MNDLFSWGEIFRLFITWLIVSPLILMLNKWTQGFTRSAIFWFLLKILVVWVIGIFTIFSYAQFLINWLSPYWHWVIGLVQSNYTVKFIISSTDKTMIGLVSTLTQAIPPLVKGDTIQVFVKAFHLLVPLVLLFSILVAWPVSTLLNRAKLLLLGIPACIFLTGFTAPFQLCGAIEAAFMAIAKQAQIPREKPLMLSWMEFLEDSGGWIRTFSLVFVGNIILNQKHIFGTDNNNVPASDKIQLRVIDKSRLK